MKRSSRFTVALAGGAVGLLAAGSAAMATTPSSGEPVQLSLLDNSIKGGKNERAAIWIEDELIPAFEAEMEAAGHSGGGLVRGPGRRRRGLQDADGPRPRLRGGSRRDVDRRHLGRRVRHRRVHPPADRRRRAGGRGVGRLGPDQRGGPGQRDVRGRPLRDPAGHRRPRHLLQQGGLRGSRPSRGLAAGDHRGGPRGGANDQGGAAGRHPDPAQWWRGDG